MGFFGPSKDEKAAAERSRKELRKECLEGERKYLRAAQVDLSRAVWNKHRAGIEKAKEEIGWRQRAIRGYGG